MKVFIADDSLAIRERLTTIIVTIPALELIGEAEDGVEARDAVLNLKPDLVILDIRMPNRLGIDVLRDIKMDNPKCKVIILTNYPYPQYRRRCLEEGADYFFEKATEFADVIATVEKLAEKCLHGAN